MRSGSWAPGEGRFPYTYEAMESVQNVLKNAKSLVRDFVDEVRHMGPPLCKTEFYGSPRRGWSI